MIEWKEHLIFNQKYGIQVLHIPIIHSEILRIYSIIIHFSFIIKMVIIIVIIMKIFIGLLQRSKENAYYKYSKKWYTRIIIIYIIGIIISTNPQPGLAESRQGRTGLVGQFEQDSTVLLFCFFFPGLHKLLFSICPTPFPLCPFSLIIYILYQWGWKQQQSMLL